MKMRMTDNNEMTGKASRRWCPMADAAKAVKLPFTPEEIKAMEKRWSDDMRRYREREAAEWEGWLEEIGRRSSETPDLEEV